MLGWEDVIHDRAVHSPAIALPVTWRLIDNPESLWALKSDWDSLWLAAQGHHSQTERSCFHAWRHDRDPSPRRLLAVTAWQGDRLVLLWPVVIRRRRWGFTTTTPLGPDAAETTDVLVAPGADAANLVAEAWRTLVGKCQADIIHLPYIRKDGALHAALPPAVGSAGTILSVGATDAPYVTWREGEDWAAYYGSLSKSYRKAHAKNLRRLATLGTATFEVVDVPARRAELARWLLTRKRVWARRAVKRGAWIEAPAFSRYLADWAGDTAVTDCVAFTLAVDGTVVAAQIASVGTGHVDWIIAAFDPAWHHLSPGVILNDHCLRWAHARGLTVELGTGREENKLFWSRGVAHSIVYCRVAGSRRGVLADRLRALAARIGRRRS